MTEIMAEIDIKTEIILEIMEIDKTIMETSEIMEIEIIEEVAQMKEEQRKTLKILQHKIQVKKRILVNITEI